MQVLPSILGARAYVLFHQPLLNDRYQFNGKWVQLKGYDCVQCLWFFSSFHINIDNQTKDHSGYQLITSCFHSSPFQVYVALYNILLFMCVNVYKKRRESAAKNKKLRIIINANLSHMLWAMYRWYLLTESPASTIKQGNTCNITIKSAISLSLESNHFVNTKGIKKSPLNPSFESNIIDKLTTQVKIILSLPLISRRWPTNGGMK